MLDFGFFHCFSRRSSPAHDQGKELAILQSIVRLGLLLVPESVILAGERFAEGHQGNPIQFIQRRLSLTLLTETELSAHQAIFGKFAIEFGLAQGRELGAVPVIYLPQPSHRGEYQVLDEISATILYRLREIFFVLADLRTLEQTVADARDTDRISIKSRTADDHRTVEAAPIKDILELLGSDKQSFEDLAAACQTVFHLFYPADKRRSELDSMSLNAFYYQQREWRVFSDIVAGENRVERALIDSEKEQLCALDDFFAQPIETTDPSTNQLLVQRRVDLCRMLEKVNGHPPAAFIRRIWVPSSAQSQARKILDRSGCTAELRVTC